MGTTAGDAIPGVVAMSAREVKTLRDRIAELEAALTDIQQFAQDVAAADRDEDMQAISRMACKALKIEE